MHRYLISLVLLAMLIIASCGGGDGDDAPADVSLTVLDFSTIVPNESATGHVIGNIEASATNGTNLTYELVSESVPGALSVGSTNGRILVADGSLFDHDLNTSISAIVEVTQGEAVSAAAIDIDIDELNAFQLLTVDYFKEIALGFEFGNASQITRKWREPMRVFVTGSTNTELREELDVIVNELTALITDDFEISFVETREASNYVVFFGSGDQYGQMFSAAAGAVASNWGLFFVNWDSEQYLNSGHMYVDIFRANDLERRHLLREEFTQSLGLARDSDRFTNSIFQSAWTRTVNYSDLDRELIRLLYHPDITTGLNDVQTEIAVRRILAAE